MQSLHPTYTTSVFTFQSRGAWEQDPEEPGISNANPSLMVPSWELGTTTAATAGDAILTLPTLHFPRIVTFFLPVLAATDKFVHA